MHHATLENCNFINNTAYENGGAIYITGDGCTLTHTVFRDNIAHDDGGAIAWYGQNGIISDLIASGNTADGENGNPSGGTLLITGNDISMDMLNISTVTLPIQYSPTVPLIPQWKIHLVVQYMFLVTIPIS